MRPGAVAAYRRNYTTPAVCSAGERDGVFNHGRVGGRRIGLHETAELGSVNIAVQRRSVG